MVWPAPTIQILPPTSKTKEKSKSLTLLVTWCAYCCSNIRVCLHTTSETCSTCNLLEISAQCQTRSRIIYNRETLRCRCHTGISVLAEKRPYSYKSQGIGLQYVTCSRKSLFSLLHKRQLIKSLLSCSQLVIVNSCWLSATSSFQFYKGSQVWASILLILRMHFQQVHKFQHLGKKKKLSHHPSLKLNFLSKYSQMGYIW